MIETKNMGCGGILGSFIVYFGIVALMALWTDRTMDFWVSHFAGHPVDVNYWWSFLLTLVSPFALTLNIISEILRAVMF